MVRSPGANDDGASALNLQGLELVSLDGMATMASLEVLNVSDNLLTNFYGIPTHPSLRCLEATNNRITSLLGMSHQPSLEVVSLEGNPICAHPEFRIMVLLACGETVSIINHRMVTDDERHLAQELGGSGGWSARCISFGWTDLAIEERSESWYQALVDDLKVNYVAMVRYRSRRDFLDFALEIERGDIVMHKWAAIATTHVFPVQPLLSRPVPPPPSTSRSSAAAGVPS